MLLIHHFFLMYELIFNDWTHTFIIYKLLQLHTHISARAHAHFYKYSRLIFLISCNKYYILCKPFEKNINVKLALQFLKKLIFCINFHSIVHRLHISNFHLHTFDVKKFFS